MIYCRWECNMVQWLWKSMWQFLTKLNTVLHDLWLMLLGICPPDLKTYVYTKVSTFMLIEALFLIAHKRKWTKFSRWVDSKLCYTYTVNYYSVIKRNELVSNKKKIVNLKCIVLSERSQSLKGILMFPVMIF